MQAKVALGFPLAWGTPIESDVNGFLGIFPGKPNYFLISYSNNFYNNFHYYFWNSF
jgi:hypothetical protein